MAGIGNVQGYSILLIKSIKLFDKCMKPSASHCTYWVGVCLFIFLYGQRPPSVPQRDAHSSPSQLSLQIHTLLPRVPHEFKLCTSPAVCTSHCHIFCSLQAMALSTLIAQPLLRRQWRHWRLAECRLRWPRWELSLRYQNSVG